MSRTFILFLLPSSASVVGCSSDDGSSAAAGALSCTYWGATDPDHCLQVEAPAITQAQRSAFSSGCTMDEGRSAEGPCATGGSLAGYCAEAGDGGIPGGSVRTYYYAPKWSAENALADCESRVGVWITPP